MNEERPFGGRTRSVMSPNYYRDTLSTPPSKRRHPSRQFDEFDGFVSPMHQEEKLRIPSANIKNLDPASSIRRPPRNTSPLSNRADDIQITLPPPPPSNRSISVVEAIFPTPKAKLKAEQLMTENVARLQQIMAETRRHQTRMSARCKTAVHRPSQRLFVGRAMCADVGAHPMDEPDDSPNTPQTVPRKPRRASPTMLAMYQRRHAGAGGKTGGPIAQAPIPTEPDHEVTPSLDDLPSPRPLTPADTATETAPDSGKVGPGSDTSTDEDHFDPTSISTRLEERMLALPPASPAVPVAMVRPETPTELRTHVDLTPHTPPGSSVLRRSGRYLGKVLSTDVNDLLQCIPRQVKQQQVAIDQERKKSEHGHMRRAVQMDRERRQRLSAAPMPSTVYDSPPAHYDLMDVEPTVGGSPPRKVPFRPPPHPVHKQPVKGQPFDLEEVTAAARSCSANARRVISREARPFSVQLTRRRQQSRLGRPSSTLNTRTVGGTMWRQSSSMPPAHRPSLALSESMLTPQFTLPSMTQSGRRVGRRERPNSPAGPATARSTLALSTMLPPAEFPSPASLPGTPERW
ncbi:hypothetical protein J8273_2725 [Carpediemonas membranifera]|uniref:Uncharacterized protein n=1 Tax=Carpediemonas membranifera TaxID=201153 RepID=A0A8J6E3E2_9EUKA|nr:hypothetical protein J8273_2725 [Carpediemonas membranifera]|eukprot:KAG9395813.1 hypothetical protein J8273_2725 [Carpediemonas membranifera]